MDDGDDGKVIVMADARVAECLDDRVKRKTKREIQLLYADG